ncbi:MAG: spoIIIJ-associated protein [Thermosediminibacterales bacterium]|nr:spoIIIJ-associated protein [Thermosediminibacterales bacterium]MDK2835701.1 spoIIIJ-associated protein [Thermosediminibacterales bacterium]
MKVIEKTGRSVEEAVESALNELNAKREDVEIEILEEPSRGIFGILSKPARVKVYLKPDLEDIAFRFISKILTAMKVNVSIDLKRKDNQLYINLFGPNLGLLIGKRGQTLDALQYLVSLVVNKHSKDYIRVIIDGEGYRKRREKTLERLASKLAKKAKLTGKKIVLEPMPPHERRIIHTALQKDPKVYTHSEGEEPFRKVIISLK